MPKNLVSEIKRLHNLDKNIKPIKLNNNNNNVNNNNNNIPNYALTKQDALNVLPKNINYNNIEIVVKNLDKSRAIKYNEWINVMFSLYNTNKNLFPIWDEFSKHFHAYDKKDCIKKWGSINDNSACKRTLKCLIEKDLKEDLANDCEKFENIKKLFEDVVEVHDLFDIDYMCNLSSYSLKKKYFEQYFCTIDYPEKLYIRYNEFETKVDNYGFSKKKRRPLIQYKPNMLCSSYPTLNKPTKINGKIIDNSFLYNWIHDNNIRHYFKIDFRPDLNVKHDILNTFTGFAITKNYINYDKTKRNDLVRLLLTFLYEIICDNDAKQFNYLLKFLANIFQKPENITGTAFLFKGNKGVGKNFFIEILEELIGSDYVTTTAKMKLLLDKHSELLANKLLITPDETDGSVTFNYTSELKAMITQKLIDINPKGLKMYSISNFCRFIFLSNNECPINIELDDRRFSVYKVSEKYRVTDNSNPNNFKYWENLRNSVMKNWKCLSAFYDYLMEIDLSNVNWIGERPLNEEYDKTQNKPPQLLWLRYNLEDIFKYVDKDTNKIRGNVFLNLYLDYRQTNHYENIKITHQAFYRFITNIKGIKKGKHDNYGENYILSKNEIKQYLTEKNMYEDFSKTIKNNNKNEKFNFFTILKKSNPTNIIMPIKNNQIDIYNKINNQIKNIYNMNLYIIKDF
jgi:hypothetical protein